jgi:branched-chain amino acid transport system substrate-binding protein
MLQFKRLAGVLALVSGLLAGGAAMADDVIRLGAAVSLTGRYSTNGEHTQRGYDLAAALINERGGVDVDGTKYQLEIVYYDDESTAARGAELAERLIQQDGVEFMLGPYSSGLTKAIAPVTEQYGVPMVEGNGASRSLFTKGYRYLFAVLSTSEQYLASAINLAAERATELGNSPSDLTVALAFENDPFSQDVREGVIEDATRHGMQIVIDDLLPRELNDMAATLAKVAALQPDVLVISGHAKGAATAIRQIQEMQINVPLLAMTHCDSADIIGKFGAAADYTLCASQWAPTLTYRDDYFGSASDYADQFSAAYGYVPPYQAAESSAAVLTFVDAFQRAGTLDQDAVRDALAATDMQTFYGNIRFDETGKNIAKPMVLYQVQDGEYVVVAPTEWAAADLIHPRPNWADR